MSVTSQDQISALLKEAYRDVFVKSIYQETNLLDAIPKYQGNVRGAQVHTAVELTRSSGGGARTAGEFLPVDSPETFAQTSITLKRWYYTLSLDGMVLSMFKKGPGAFADYLSLRMGNAQRDASNQLNRICHMDGTGVLAVVNGSQTGKGGASDGVLIKHVWPNGFKQNPASGTAFGAGSASSYSFGATQFLEEGDKIGIATPSYSGGWSIGTVNTGTISAIDWDSQKIEFADGKTMTVTDGDVIFAADSHSNSFNKEVAGLKHLITGKNDRTVLGISTANRRWRSTEIDKTAAPVPYDWTHLTRIVAATKFKGSTQPGGLVLMMNPAMLEEHQRLVDPDIAYEETSSNFAKTLTVPTFTVLGQKVPVRTSIHCGFQEVIGLNTTELERMELEPMDWDDRGGQIKPLQGKDACYAYLKLFWALSATALNHQARFDGIQVDTEFVKVLQETA